MDLYTRCMYCNQRIYLDLEEKEKKKIESSLYTEFYNELLFFGLECPFCFKKQFLPFSTLKAELPRFQTMKTCIYTAIGSLFGFLFGIVVAYATGMIMLLLLFLLGAFLGLYKGIIEERKEMDKVYKFNAKVLGGR